MRHGNTVADALLKYKRFKHISRFANSAAWYSYYSLIIEFPWLFNNIKSWQLQFMKFQAMCCRQQNRQHVYLDSSRNLVILLTRFPISSNRVNQKAAIWTPCVFTGVKATFLRRNLMIYIIMSLFELGINNKGFIHTCTCLLCKYIEYNKCILSSNNKTGKWHNLFEQPSSPVCVLIWKTCWERSLSDNKLNCNVLCLKCH